MASLSDLINFLSSSDSYSYETGEVKIIQTHVSVLSLNQEHVYKIKKPVNFEFLDFSTLEKRKFYCEEELRLNQRLTDGIYLGVVPIYQTNGVLSFESGDEIVEYAVKMNRLLEDGFLDHLVARGDDASIHYTSIVDRLSEFYEELPPQQIDPNYGTKESIAYIIDENCLLRRQFIGRTLTAVQEGIITEYQQQFLKLRTDLLEQRVSEGWIRDVHGDLRLEHFHFNGGHLNIYDCIEFKERLRVNDLINDIAFLCMELEFHGRYEESCWVYDKIAERLRDRPHHHLWRFYKTHRACVRGMVHAVAAFEPEVEQSDRVINHQKSEQLFSLATRYALLGHEPTVIVVYGGVATGKSTMASLVSDALRIPHLQSDAVRKELAGLPAHDRPAESVREWLYSADMTTRTYEELVQQARNELRKHNVVLIDARLPTLSARQLIATGLSHARIIWLQTIADVTSRMQRLKDRDNRPSISDARQDNWELLTGGENELSDDGGYPVLTINTTQSKELCLEQMLTGIKTLSGS